MLSNDELRKTLLEGKCKNSHGKFEYIQDGAVLSNHPLFSSDGTNTLQIILYSDEIELCNAVGTRVKKFKLLMFYYMIGKLPKIYRSVLSAINLYAVAKSEDVATYGFDSILQPLPEDIHKLSTVGGYPIHLKNGNLIRINAALVAYVADNPAAHQAIGAIALWGSSKSLQTLEDIHIRAARFIFNIKESTLSTEVLAMTKWKSLSYIYKVRIATISYQAFYNRAPAGISSLFTKHSPLRNLRDNLKLYVQRPKSDFLRSSFCHRASILWNNLPMYLKSKPSVISFKSALKAKSNILDKITFNGMQGINKDIVNYIY